MNGPRDVSVVEQPIGRANVDPIDLDFEPLFKIRRPPCKRTRPARAVVGRRLAVQSLPGPRHSAAGHAHHPGSGVPGQAERELVMQLGLSLFLIAIATLVVWTLIRAVSHPGARVTTPARAPLPFAVPTVSEDRVQDLPRAA
jgi:hypothetical protein